MRTRFYSYFLSMLTLCLATGCIHPEKKKSSSTSGSTTLVCDNSFENIMEQEIDVFEYIYPDAHILARYATEREAVDSLLTLNTKTIIIPRELTKDEINRIKKQNRTPRWSKIAVDAVALIVNEENALNALSMKEISEILSGDTKSWLDLGPHYPDKPIAIIFDDRNSSLLTYMRDSLLNGEKLGQNVYAQGSIQGVIDAVKENVNAIGVVGVSWLSTDLGDIERPIQERATEIQDENETISMDEINQRVKDSGVKVLGVMRDDDPRAYRPFQENIYNGTYPLTRSIYMITTGHSGSPAGGFYSFVTGFIGQKIIMKTGVLPSRMHINVVELVD